jgi:hypothetical protein
MRCTAVMMALLLLCPPALAAGLELPKATETLSNPDDGKVVDGVYVNHYFGLSYRLLPGWTEDLAGPEPSHSGYYVLSTLMPADGQRAMILLTAHDTFFAAAPFRDAPTMAREISRTMAAIAGTTIDVPPSEVEVAGRPFSRVDYSGFGLYRSALVTPIRCHLVSFNITTASPELRAAVVKSFDRLGRIDQAGDTDPVCKANQASPELVVARFDPPASAPYAPPIPVRLIIDAAGGVRHVHVIRATAPQRTAIETALGQWRFRPLSLDEGAMALETGMLIQFMPGGAVSYLPGDRVPPE